MKLTLNLDALKNAVNVVKGATESGATNFSLLEGIMIEVTGEERFICGVPTGQPA